jgi:hypothetical protein
MIGGSKRISACSRRISPGPTADKDKATGSSDVLGRVCHSGVATRNLNRFLQLAKMDAGHADNQKNRDTNSRLLRSFCDSR